MKDNLLDRVAKQALQDYEVPYQAAHWDLLQRKMQQNHAQTRHTLWFVKGVEGLLMLTTVLTLFYYGNAAFAPAIIVPTALQIAAAPQYAVPTSANICTNTAANTPQSTTENLPETTIAQPINATLYKPVVTVYGHTTAAPTVAPIMASALENSNTTNATQPYSITNFTPIAPNSTLNNTAENIIPTTIAAQHTPAVANTALAEGVIIVEAAPSVVHNYSMETLLRQQFGVNVLPALDMPILTIAEPAITLPPRELLLADGDKPYEDFAPRLSRFTLRVAASPADYNVVTQFSPNGNHSIDALGRSLGITTLFRFAQNWRVETGLRLASRKYDTSKNYTTTVNTRDIVQHTDLTLLELPVEIMGNLVATEKWRIYAKAGASWYNVLQANYVWRNGTIATVNNDQTTADLTAIQSEQVLGINNNNYWSGNIGIGIERRIGKRGSLFMEPTYHQALSGLGARADKTNTMSLVFGASYTL
jgi:hypothetical protein